MMLKPINMQLLKFISCALIFVVYHSINAQRLSNPFEQPFVQANATDQVDHQYYRLVQFKHLLSQEEKLNLSREGILVDSYISGTTYLCTIQQSIQNRSTNKIMISSSVVEPKQKMSDEFSNGVRCTNNPNYGTYIIKYMPHISDALLSSLCDQAGLQLIKQSNPDRIFYTDYDPKKVAELANLPWIEYIACKPAPGQPEDREGRSLHRVNQISANFKENLFLDGEGVSICVRDDGFVGPHIDFKGRITNDVYGQDGTHGDMTSGIACGAGNIDPLISGMAPAAKLFVINYQDDFLDQTLNLHQKQGVVITNNSYSNGCNAGYTAITQIVDKQLFDNPNLLHVFSAGNANGSDCGYGAGTQWGNITGGHKIGKNVITVANVMIGGTIDPTSSRGPTKDGRLKPDVSARGNGELSTLNGNAYQVGGGTSAACPGVAGTSALLYQAYKKFNGQNPEAALIKATLMNTATDIGPIGPDFTFGYGMIDAYRAYKLLEEKRYQKLIINQQEIKEIEIQVPTGIAKAKFMIYWAEKESSLLAKKVLINDIDMEVINPTGTTILPLITNPTSDPNTLGLDAQPGIDTLNNFEQVSISFPVSGTYKIRIKGKFLPDNQVPFYLLYELEDKALRLTSPLGGEKFTSLESTNLYFTAYGSDSIKVRFSSNGGRTWSNIKNYLSGVRLGTWTVPLGINSDSCLMEVIQGNEIDRSGFFTITNAVTGVKAKKYCPNELILTWNRTKKDSFIIYAIGEQFMYPFMKVTDTFAIIPIDDPRKDWWFSVAGYTGSALSRRTKAIKIPDTLIACTITDDISIRPSNESLDNTYVSCGNQTIIYPQVTIQNRYRHTISNFSIQYYDQNNLISEPVTSVLDYNDSTTITLNNGIHLDFNGKKNIPIWIQLATDQNPYNDTTSISVDNRLINDPNGVYPMIENFDQALFPTTWEVVNSIPASAWQVKSQKNKTGQSSNVIQFNNSVFNYLGFNVDFYTNTIDLSTAINPYLYFDYAYHKQLEYTSYHDSLYVEVQTMCEGKTMTQRVFASGGPSLYTVDTSSRLNWVPFAASNWRTVAYDLSPFKGKKITVKFKYLRGLEGNMFIDHIHVKEKTNETEVVQLGRNLNEVCTSTEIIYNTVELPGATYAWDFGEYAIPRTSSVAGPNSVKYSLPGKKTITLFVKYLSFTYVDARTIEVFGNSNANFSFIKELNNGVRFQNNSTYIKDALWEFGDNSTSTEINPTHQFPAAQKYQVKLSNTNACGASFKTQEVDLTPVSNQDESKTSVLIYPNPTHHQMMVKSNEFIHYIKISAITGKTIRTIHFNKPEYQIELDTKMLANGMYILEMNSGISRQTVKFEKVE